MSVDDFSIGQGGLGQWYKTTSEPTTSATTLLDPNLELEPEPADDTLTLPELPTFHVTRHPEHWCAIALPIRPHLVHLTSRLRLCCHLRG